MATRLKIRDADREWTADVAAATVTLQNVPDPFQIKDRGDGRWAVVHGSSIADACAAVQGDIVWIAMDGELFDIRVDRDAGRRRETKGGDTLMAPMPATVVRIIAPVGTKVAQGDPLLMLEAMKMELPIRAPHDGVVSAVHCREGELVQAGVVLVEVR